MVNYIVLECPKCKYHTFYLVTVKNTLIFKCSRCLYELDRDGILVPLAIGKKLEGV